MNQTYDIDFQVPFTHRLRFTGDVLGGDEQQLLDVLMPIDQKVRVLFVVDAGVSEGDPTLLPRLRDFVSRNSDRVEQVNSIVEIPGGEACKNDPKVVDGLLKALNDNDVDRRNYVLVVGGGAVLDAVGFAAAVAHRGVRLIRLPTTTLAQDDSGIGVKNAVNLFGKKNWKGSFAVPWAVINDAKLLETLPDRDFRCGFTEAVKVSLLKDGDFFGRICRDARRIARRDMDAALPVIEESAVWHLRHITEGGDPFEMLEARPLDYGHWSAHKLEQMTNFRLRHGEAVGIGIAIDCHYAHRKLGMTAADVGRVIACLKDLGVPLSDKSLADEDALLDGLEEFRQHLGGRLTITMVQSPGEAIDLHEIDMDVMRDSIRAVRETLDRKAAKPAPLHA
jgi:3-dehydroquinate synthase